MVARPGRWNSQWQQLAVTLCGWKFHSFHFDAMVPYAIQRINHVVPADSSENSGRDKGEGIAFSASHKACTTSIAIAPPSRRTGTVNR